LSILFQIQSFLRIEFVRLLKVKNHTLKIVGFFFGALHAPTPRRVPKLRLHGGCLAGSNDLLPNLETFLRCLFKPSVPTICRAWLLDDYRRFRDIQLSKSDLKCYGHLVASRIKIGINKKSLLCSLFLIYLIFSGDEIVIDLQMNPYQGDLFGVEYFTTLLYLLYLSPSSTNHFFSLSIVMSNLVNGRS
jgi:hypothetical protein